MMTEFEPRLFDDVATVRRVGQGLIDCSLPRAEWTHEAHIATCAWLILERPDLVPERDLPGLIRRYNESVGGVNDDTQGYHETITQMFILGVRQALTRSKGRCLADRVNRLLLSAEGRRDWPLTFYSQASLFSVAARREWIEPDLRPLTRSANGGVCAKKRGSSFPVSAKPSLRSTGW
ncbi:MAG: hypothetical protein ACT4OE_01255 [Sphingosinicella sp.]